MQKDIVLEEEMILFETKRILQKGTVITVAGNSWNGQTPISYKIGEMFQCDFVSTEVLDRYL